MSSVLHDSTGYEDAETNGELSIQNIRDLKWCLQEGLVGRMVVEKGFCHQRVSSVDAQEHNREPTASFDPYRDVCQHVETNADKPVAYPHP